MQSATGKPGIIPARAGFTWSRGGAPRCRWDHPRSRGVYRHRPVRGGPRRGSSPLARGLRVHGRGHTHRCRIIPARAGFTSWASEMTACAPDHPRSRGVYFVTWIICIKIRGSSPLARGLPRGDARRAVGRAGSSPLARGLLATLTVLLLTPGIIPARAGFTGLGRRCCLRWGDHPRSRGVYTLRRSWSPPIWGSSPLARGLHGSLMDTARIARIIPARAGFTREG